MRTLNLIRGDLRFINKYGVTFVYAVFTVVYLLVLGLIVGEARGITAAILIYTDPAAMGLFFMGAIIMLEKSQHVNCSLGVTPITVNEFILSKIVSLLIPGSIVAAILGAFASPMWLISAVPAVILSSAIFSLCGLISAVYSKSLNGFIITVIPFEILICVPAVYSLFGNLDSRLWMLHPGVAAMRMITGDMSYWFIGIPGMVFWLLIAFHFCKRVVNKYFMEMGGGRIL